MKAKVDDRIVEIIDATFEYRDEEGELCSFELGGLFSEILYEPTPDMLDAVRAVVALFTVEGKDPYPAIEAILMYQSEQ